MMNTQEALCQIVDQLIDFACKHLYLQQIDVDWARNRVLELLHCSYYEPTGATSNEQSIDQLLEQLQLILYRNRDYSSPQDLMTGTTINAHPALDWAALCDAIMDALSMDPSSVVQHFQHVAKQSSPMHAMQWLYDYCGDSTYIKRAQLQANPRFTSHGLIITINAAKPEYTSMKRAAEGNSVGEGYPQCTICHENVGFAGKNKRTLRTIPLKLCGEDWFWQFSPYGYFNQHGICVNAHHTPMKVDCQTFYRLMAFVDQFPGYFLGCNAALPRIGGSILAHDHYQGGGELLPMHTASSIATLVHPQYQHIVLELIDWQGSAFRIVGQDQDEIAEVCEYIRTHWNSYDNPALHIFSHDENGHRQSSISPSVVRTQRGYEMSIILRNNAVTPEFPDGVFHAHPQYYAIKQEPIGLIEAQGLFILPGRLVQQFEELAPYVRNRQDLPHALSSFEILYRRLLARTVPLCTHEQYVDALHDELGVICQEILHNTAVFQHRKDLQSWLHTLGFISSTAD